MEDILEADGLISKRNLKLQFESKNMEPIVIVLIVMVIIGIAAVGIAIKYLRKTIK